MNNTNSKLLFVDFSFYNLKIIQLEQYLQEIISNK